MRRKSALAMCAVVLAFAFAFSQGITDRARRKELEKAFKAKYGAIYTIDWSNATNCVSLLEGRFATGDSASDSVAAVRVALDFLNENREMLGIEVADLCFTSAYYGEFRSFYRVRFAEYHEGVRVEDAKTLVDIQLDGSVLTVATGYVPDITVPVVPSIGGDVAVSIAAKLYELPFGPDDPPRLELVIYPLKKDSTMVCHLAWRVRYIESTYYIDAVDGSQVARTGNLVR
jgi:Zn-dependent metalloprotease